MNKTRYLFDLCMKHSMSVSLSWQKPIGWSIEILRPYRNFYITMFYKKATSKKEILTQAVDFMKDYNPYKWEGEFLKDKRLMTDVAFMKKYRVPKR